MCSSRDHTQKNEKRSHHVVQLSFYLDYAAALPSAAHSRVLPLSSAPPCCCIVRRLLASRHRLPAPGAATLPPTSSLRPPPPPPPSLVARRAVHPLLLPQPTTTVDRPRRSSRFFFRRLLSFSSSPVHVCSDRHRRSPRREDKGCRCHGPCAEAVFVCVLAGGAVASAVVVAPRHNIVFVVIDAATIGV
jgi:hypothetical protein